MELQKWNIVGHEMMEIGMIFMEHLEVPHEFWGWFYMLHKAIWIHISLFVQGVLLFLAGHDWMNLVIISAGQNGVINLVHAGIDTPLPNLKMPPWCWGLNLFQRYDGMIIS